MNASLKRTATLVGIYLMVLLAAVLTGMVYTGEPNVAAWTADMRATIASTPLPIVAMMFFMGMI